MKKLLIISISIMIVLALSSSVMAKAVNLELPQFDLIDPLETGLGKVILNNPSGEINFVVQVNIKGAQIDHTYVVWIYYGSGSWINLGELLTNAVGNGSFHLNMTLPEATLTGIIVALNEVVPFNHRQYSSDPSGEIVIK